MGTGTGKRAKGTGRDTDTVCGRREEREERENGTVSLPERTWEASEASEASESSDRGFRCRTRCQMSGVWGSARARARVRGVGVGVGVGVAAKELGETVAVSVGMGLAFLPFFLPFCLFAFWRFRFCLRALYLLPSSSGLDALRLWTPGRLSLPGSWQLASYIQVQADPHSAQFKPQVTS